MGSGKSTYGAEAASMLGLPFLDLDTEIERSAGMGISDIFREKGEAAFRVLERDTLRALASRGSSVATPSAAMFLILIMMCGFQKSAFLV